MSCVIVNDASALIDLKKGELLHVLGALPFRWIIPLPIREEEILSFSGQDWAILDAAGFEVFDLPPNLVGQAFAVRREFPRLSANDCFCLVSAEDQENSVLLGGASRRTTFWSRYSFLTCQVIIGNTTGGNVKCKR